MLSPVIHLNVFEMTRSRRVHNFLCNLLPAEFFEGTFLCSMWLFHGAHYESKITDKCISLLLRTRNNPGSNLTHEIGYLYWDLSFFLLILCGQFSERRVSLSSLR